MASGRDVRDTVPEVTSPAGETGRLGVQETGAEAEAERVGVAKRSSAASDFYPMGHPRRGRALIINNRRFAAGTGLMERRGSDKDAQRLYVVLAEMGFTPKLVNDVSGQAMRDALTQVASESHKDADCFLCAVLSHGDRDQVYGTDSLVPIDDLLTPLKACPSLVGKPKIFIIQACRGGKMDVGVEVADAVGVMPGKEEDTAAMRKIPLEADFLLAFSTVPGYCAWRDQLRGSWYVQALVSVLRERWRTADLLTMLTLVSQRVAVHCQSSVATSPTLSGMKQMPCVVSMLTHILHFSHPAPPPPPLASTQQLTGPQS